MPIYEYACKSCGSHHEVMQKISDPQVTVCPSCEGEVYRVISPSGLSFKGAGWYITDYARKGKETESGTKTEKKEGAPATPAAPSVEKKGEAPAAKDIKTEKTDKGNTK
jgi:putative FmdB family regulatory protein